MFVSRKFRNQIRCSDRNAYEFAREIGISRSTFSSLINGAISADGYRDRLLKVADALGVDHGEAFVEVEKVTAGA